MAFPLFSRYGVELEYMIVSTDDLSVRPWSDRVLLSPQGQPVSDLERGPVTWSNELSAHVIELKTSAPVPSLDGVAAAFDAEVRELNRRLAPHRACLLPTAMHPFMRPEQAVLWTHEYSEVYATFDRIFNCHGHGWSNLQSVHLNLPFANDEEFGRLHAAIRLVLPLLPALAASSPLVEGRLTGLADNRLAYYRDNSKKIPSLCGGVIPPPVFTEADYHREIFDPIRRDLAPHDPAGVLEPEFSNSRGAIARFSRGSIEIRLLDLQENPAADLFIVRTVVAVLQELVAESQSSYASQKALSSASLGSLLTTTIAQADAASDLPPELLSALGLPPSTLSAGEAWRALIARLSPCAQASAAEQAAEQTWLRHGPLARRLTQALLDHHSPADLYTRLARQIGPPVPFTP